MPLKTGKLTPKEALFVGHMAHTGDPTYSAKMAGYSVPVQDGHRKSHDPALSMAIKKAQTTRLFNEALPLTLDFIVSALQDPKETSRIKLGVAQTVLKYTLGQSEGADSKEPHEMTPQELQARIDSLRRAMADKAKPIIEGNANEPGPDGSVFD